MTYRYVPPRLSRRVTALLFLALYLPLFALILSNGLDDVAAPLTDGATHPEQGSLPPRAVWSLAAVAPLAIVVPLTLFLANFERLRGVFRARWGKFLSAAVLALVTPFDVVGWQPWIPGGLWLYAVGGAVNAGSPVSVVAALLALPVGLAVGTVIWYIPTCLVISGIRRYSLRFAAFLGIWWSLYALILLSSGYDTVLI